jgi:predicted Zn-dependent protease
MCAEALGQGGDPKPFESSLKQGFELHRQARFAEAIPVLEQARKLQTGDYFVNLLLGIDELRTGDAKAAIPRLQLAAHARSSEAIPEEYMGEAEARLGDYAQAAEAYQAAVARGHGGEDAQEA